MEESNFLNNAGNIIILIHDSDTVANPVGKAKENNKAGGNIAEYRPLSKQRYADYGEYRGEKDGDLGILKPECANQ
ncbi:hypothetical protein GL2_41740 [Microbulbifer sp. GL-2]|nr:hypothetical protein GL2_41740 [Microbulbifer sp. GL-2]